MPVKMIGDILTAQLPHMQPYIRFCSCQLNGAALIQQKTDEAPDFKEFVKVRLRQDLAHQVAGIRQLGVWGANSEGIIQNLWCYLEASLKLPFHLPGFPEQAGLRFLILLNMSTHHLLVASLHQQREWPGTPVDPLLLSQVVLDGLCLQEA